MQPTWGKLLHYFRHCTRFSLMKLPPKFAEINLLSYLFRCCCDGGIVRQHERRDDLVHGRRHPRGSLSVRAGQNFTIFSLWIKISCDLTLSICPINVLTLKHATSNLAANSLSIKIFKNLWVSANILRWNLPSNWPGNLPVLRENIYDYSPKIRWKSPYNSPLKWNFPIMGKKWVLLHFY